MTDPGFAVRLQLRRQVAHWSLAASMLAELDELAPAEAWRQLERYLGITVRNELAASSERLDRRANLMSAALAAAVTLPELDAVNHLLIDFRRQYLRTETTLDFFAHAIRSRTDATLGSLLRACDTLAYRAMAAVLDQLDKKVPPVLTFLDTGLGASILKAGLRLWDGADCPVAAIKVTRHNLTRPTSILHEAGHQVAHLTGWTQELAAAYGDLGGAHGAAREWAYWSSEIVADAHAFVHSGFAAVATLHDVVAGSDADVFRHLPGDPHPIAYLRVLLGVEMCRQCFGSGPWDDLALAWTELHPLRRAPDEARELIEASLPLVARAADICLRRPARGFGGRSICDLIHPDRVRPSTLEDMERTLGPALYSSTHWIWTESLRLLALSGLRLVTSPERATEIARRQQEWMLRLGGTAQAA